MLVYTVKNQPIDSNCYILHQAGKEVCVIIDPGTNGSEDVIKFLELHGLIPGYIILTHEHFDHVWGVQSLVDKYYCKVICSNLCGRRISSAKSNLSFFYDQLGFTVKADTLPSELLTNGLSFYDSQIVFKNTPGHTDSSICILTGDFLFTGDTLIPGEKIVTKLPTGSKEAFSTTLSWMKELFTADYYTVYPGHGAPTTSFVLREALNQFSL
jgi:glyoxylase-like metal-dependent hydrolase (beta-lactamase superfamily II)